jgi:metal-sulfur cluster biosynthetic enzyme
MTFRESTSPDPREHATTDAEVRDGVLQALRAVIDPEIGLDVVSLGLIYDVTVTADVVSITYTLTTPGCPLAEYMRSAILHGAAPAAGQRQVELRLVFDPVWTPERIEEMSW